MAINMMPVGDGNYYLYLHGDVRKASGTTIGDRVRIDISFDGLYSKGLTDPMPVWFSEALAKNRRAAAYWQALAPSRKKEVLRNVSRVKSEEARKRNLREAMHALSGGKGRFRARTWNE